MAAISPFRFTWGDYPARRVHPLSKLAALLSASFAAVRAPTLWLAALAGLGFLALASAGAFRPNMRQGFAALARNARFLLPLGVFIILFRVIDPWGSSLFQPGEILPALLYISRLAVVFIFAEAYFRSTSAEELAAATTGLARRLTRRDNLDPGLFLSLAVNFIPRCFDAWERSRDAARTRGYGGKKGGIPRFHSSLILLESFIATNIRQALSTSEALETRCYTPARGIAPRRFKAADFALLSASIAIAIFGTLG